MSGIREDFAFSPNGAVDSAFGMNSEAPCGSHSSCPRSQRPI